MIFFFVCPPIITAVLESPHWRTPHWSLRLQRLQNIKWLIIILSSGQQGYRTDTPYLPCFSECILFQFWTKSWSALLTLNQKILTKMLKLTRLAIVYNVCYSWWLYNISVWHCRNICNVSRDWREMSDDIPPLSPHCSCPHWTSLGCCIMRWGTAYDDCFHSGGHWGTWREVGLNCPLPTLLVCCSKQWQGIIILCSFNTRRCLPCHSLSLVLIPSHHNITMWVLHW